MENKDFKKLISKLLEPYGFKRAKNVWYRRNDGVFAVLTIESHPYCRGWFVEFGAEFAHTEYEMKSFESDLDFADLAVFPKEPTADSEWKEYKHQIPMRAPVKSHIDLDLFSDAEIEEYMRFNIKRSLVPLLTKESLLETVQNDPYYLWMGREKNLPLYGFSAEEIQEKNVHVR